jgi:uncharacterized protein YkwD
MKKPPIKFSFLFHLILLLLIGCEDDPVATNNNTTLSNSIESEVHRLINLHRTGMGLEPLEWNATIAVECRNHSIEMANAQSINHNGFYDRVDRIKAKIPWSWAGENVALNRGAQAAVTSWLNSPGHKSNIESNSNLTGVGVAFDSDSAMYFTQIFIKSSN